MSNKPKKMKFIVEENETIAECLERMDKEGYRPTRRMEEPVFIEEKENGQIVQKHLRQKITFEGILK